MFDAEIGRHFRSLGETTYLNTASMGAGPQAAADALAEAAGAWAAGRFDWPDAERAGEEVRASFGRLVGAETDAVALIPSASMVAGLVAHHLRVRYPQGGNIVVGAAEFTSNLYPWLGLEAHGFEIRRVPFVDGHPPEAAMAAAVDDGTRLLAVSAIQSAVGYRADLARLRTAARGALLYVDAAQAAGAVPIDMGVLGIDALAAPNHKFLLGVRGLGYGAFSPRLRDALEPVWPGWKAAAEPMASFYGPDMRLSATASRFDQSLAWHSAITERASARVLDELGRARIHEHNAVLARRLTAGLRDAGVPFLDHGDAHRSPIVSVAPASPDAGARLAEAGVVAAVREGRVRLAVHVYVTAAQVDAVVELLARP